MSSTELVLLDELLKERQRDRAAPLPEDDAFELFACEQVMRERDLGVEEVGLGVVGGGNDGAIDGIYAFMGDALLSEDSEVFQDDFSPGKVPSGVRLTLWLVQAKRETSFTETAIDKVASSTRRLLGLAEADEDLLKLYSAAVVTRTGMFRRALRTLATRHPQVHLRFSYVTRGKISEINTKVEIKARDLESQLREVTPGAGASVQLLGAAELWRRASAVPSYTVELSYQENATSGTSHVALVKLRDYMAFLTDDQGALRRHIFDWNVRDYQGDVEVNREIRNSLNDTAGPEFWWLNNGVTILCSKTSIVGKTYILDDVQIVNGLQTSHTIHRFLSDSDVPDDHPALERSVLVRILVTGDDAQTRDRVIRATNRQTSVPAASLRATDDVQRNIESFFLMHGWFYDRRKNFYRNQGRSPERIIGIPLLAQAVMAMGLSRPDNSRARPSSLLKRDDDYKKVFSSTIPVETYLWLAKSQKSVDAFMASSSAITTSQERTNLRFHLAMMAATKLVGSHVQSPAQLASVAKQDRDIAGADLLTCLNELRQNFSDFAMSTGHAADTIAKGPDFVKFVLHKALG